MEGDADARGLEMDPTPVSAIGIDEIVQVLWSDYYGAALVGEGGGIARLPYKGCRHEVIGTAEGSHREVNPVLPAEVIRHKGAFCFAARFELPSGTAAGLWHLVGFTLRLIPDRLAPVPSEEATLDRAIGQTGPGKGQMGSRWTATIAMFRTEVADMRCAQSLRVVLGCLASVATVGRPALAQGVPTPARPGGEASGGLFFVVVMIVLLAIIGIGVKLLDLRRKRSGDAMLLQARIADVLLLDPALATLPVAATAHVSLWHSSPVTIEVTGRVPSPSLREAALDAVRKEASRAGVEFRIEDRLEVVPRAA